MKRKEPVSDAQAFWLVGLTFAATAIVFLLSGTPLTRSEWLEVLKVAGSALTVGIAYLALKNWQRQDRAKREAEFLDALIEAMHTYATQLTIPTSMLEMSLIGFRSYEPSGGDDREIRGAISYIEKYGEAEAKQLRESLQAVRDTVVRLNSLATKGQVFRFDDYAKCRNAISILAWQFDRIQAFAHVLGSPSMNWRNPIVRKHLQNIIKIKPDEIHSSMAAEQVTVLTFASDTYAQIYGSRS